METNALESTYPNLYNSKACITGVYSFRRQDGTKVRLITSVNSFMSGILQLRSITL
jgi:hypothetical protein